MADERDETVKIGIVDFAEDQLAAIETLQHQAANRAYVHGCLDTLWSVFRAILAIMMFGMVLWYFDRGTK